MRHYLDLRDKTDVVICESLGHLWEHFTYNFSPYEYRQCSRCRVIQYKVGVNVWKTVDITVESV